MPAATLLCDTSAPPPRVYPLEAAYEVRVEGYPVPGAIVGPIEFPTPNTVGSVDIMFPRKLTVAGISFDGDPVPPVTFGNPALDLLAVGRRVEVWVDGYDRMFAGPLVQPPDIDYLTGWVTIHCKDETEHANHTNNGVGRNTGWVYSNPPTDPGDPTNPDDPLVLGWTGLNAVVNADTSPWGYAVSVGYGKDRGGSRKTQEARYHAAVHTFDLGQYDRLELNAVAKPAVGSSKVKFITMNRVNPDAPKVQEKISVSMPSLADGKWSDPFGLTTCEGPGKVNIAVWSPMPGRHFNAVSIRYKITSTADKPPDPTDPKDPPRVPAGGTSTDMKTRLYGAAFAAAESGAFAVNHGGGYVFTDGMKIEADNTSTFGSLASQFDSTAETLWDPGTMTLDVYAKMGAGVQRPELRALVEGQSRQHATSFTGGQDVPVARNTVDASTDNATFSFTYVHDGGGRPPWDRVLTAPTGMSPADAAQIADAELSTEQITVPLTTPPGGRSPLDWWHLRGIRGGDWVPVSAAAGAWTPGQLRIVGMRGDPTKGTMLLTLAPS